MVYTFIKGTLKNVSLKKYINKNALINSLK